MKHNWLPICADDKGECAWVCQHCAQVAQARPVVKTATEKCAKLFWKSLDKPLRAC